VVFGGAQVFVAQQLFDHGQQLFFTALRPVAAFAPTGANGEKLLVQSSPSIVNRLAKPLAVAR
jgi:hypothetical protein